MKSHLLPLGLASVLVLCAGCATDDYARKIIEYNTTAGRVLQDLAGSGVQLIQQKQIDAQRRIPAPDKAEMDVYVIKAKPDPSGQRKGALGTMVILHGLTGSKWEFPYFGAGQVLSKKGYDVVLMDLRSHGRSGGKYVTYGAMEKNDVKAVIDSLLKEGMINDSIYVFGATLGGAVAIQYAAIDPRCKGVLAMTPYKDMASIARRWMPMTMSDEDFQKVMTRAGEIAAFNPAEASSVEAAKKLHCPLLLVHGVIDLSVPFDHSQAIYDAATGTKKLLAVTPGPEQVGLAIILEDWIANNMDMIAHGKIQEATTQPVK